MENNELQHWGIPGMKWGVRRFQNKDGSLTSAGKKRVSRKVQKQREEALKKARDAREAKKKMEEKKEQLIRSGDAKSILKNKQLFTNAELQKAIDRLDLEQKISAVSDKRVSRGRNVVYDILEKSSKNIGSQTMTLLMGVGVNKILYKLLDDPRAINPKLGQKDK